MPKAVKDMLDAANAAAPRLSPDEVRARIDAAALTLDVREIEAHGRIPGAHHVSRRMLEFRADPASPLHDPIFQMDRPIIVYCASDGRSALAGQVLKETGYSEVHDIGACKNRSPPAARSKRCSTPLCPFTPHPIHAPITERTPLTDPPAWTSRSPSPSP